MSDLYAFRAVRSLRRAEPVDDFTMVTEWVEIDPEIREREVRLPWRGQQLLPDLRELVNTSEDPPGKAPGRAEAYLGSVTAVTLETLRGGVDPASTLPEPDEAGEPVLIPGQPGLALVDRLDRWLVTKNNRPGPAKLDDWLRTALQQLAEELSVETPADDDNADPDVEPPSLPLEKRGTLNGVLAATWGRLLDSLAAALLLPAEGELAQRLNRLLLVAGLIERRSFYRRQLARDEIVLLLARRTLLLPDPPFPDVIPESQVKLVRQATTSDLFVARREWRAYVPDEVADIRNVLTGESSKSRFTRIDESELVELASKQQDSTTETSSEASDESTFNEQSKRELDLQLHAEGQVDISSEYGGVKLDASAGFSADFSLEDSTERATQIVKKAIARAASKIETQTHEERMRRTLARTELQQRHSLTNDNGSHVRGVYRWVKRIDRFQIWRYPDRFQLEFQLPEPGRYLLDQLKELPTRPGALDKPPNFALPEEGITIGNYLMLATRYNATGLPEPPQATVGASSAVSLASKEPNTAATGDMWNPPTLSDLREIPVPAGYAVTKVKVRVEASPIHAKWVREQTKANGWQTVETFHTITAAVAVGDQMIFEKQVGPDPGNANSIQSTGSDDPPQVQFLQAHLYADSGELALGNPVTVKLPIAVSVAGADSATVGVELRCEITQQAKDAWVQDVYDGLHAAYDAWLREWRSQQSMAGTPATLAERSPARHQEMIRAEIRRHVIAWLLGESPFLGRPAVSDDTRDIKVSTVLDSAATIQFLEQCLEWSNLAWVTYPYYWADRTRWSDLMDLETIDSALGEFLRAGSIRVVVPARPGFSAAVIHWLTFRQPWLGSSCAPVPGQPLYVSVAREIQNQLMPPPDGTPGESWEVALPTTLQWLDDKGPLPRNALARLGQAPHEPADVLTPAEPVP